MTNTETVTLTLTGDQVGVTFSSPYFTESADAEAFVTLFPKSAKLRVFTMRGDTEADDRYGADVRIELWANGVNGGVNETGIKRYRAILKAAATNGIKVEYAPTTVHSFSSRDALETPFGI